MLTSNQSAVSKTDLEASVHISFFAIFEQAGLSPQPVRHRVLHHIRHVLCGGTTGHQWAISGCQGGSSG